MLRPGSKCYLHVDYTTPAPKGSTNPSLTGKNCQSLPEGVVLMCIYIYIHTYTYISLCANVYVIWLFLSPFRSFIAGFQNLFRRSGIFRQSTAESCCKRSAHGLLEPVLFLLKVLVCCCMFALFGDKGVATTLVVKRPRAFLDDLALDYHHRAPLVGESWQPRQRFGGVPGEPGGSGNVSDLLAGAARWCTWQGWC